MFPWRYCVKNFVWNCYRLNHTFLLCIKLTIFCLSIWETKYYLSVLPLVLQVVMVTAGVFVLLPVLPVSTGCQRHNVLPVVDMMECVSGVRADACQISFPFEHQQVFPSWWDRVSHQPASLSTFLRVILGEERDGHVEAGPEVFCVQAGFS